MTAARRGLDSKTSEFLALDAERRRLQTTIQQALARRNDASKEIGEAKRKGENEAASALMAEVAGLKDAIQSGEQKQRELEAELRTALAVIPNIPADDVRTMVDTNMLGTIYGSQVAVRGMTAQGRGAVFNVADMCIVGSAILMVGLTLFGVDVSGRHSAGAVGERAA